MLIYERAKNRWFREVYIPLRGTRTIAGCDMCPIGDKDCVPESVWRCRCEENNTYLEEVIPEPAWKKYVNNGDTSP